MPYDPIRQKVWDILIVKSNWYIMLREADQVSEPDYSPRKYSPGRLPRPSAMKDVIKRVFQKSGLPSVPEAPGLDR